MRRGLFSSDSTVEKLTGENAELLGGEVLNPHTVGDGEKVAGLADIAEVGVVGDAGHLGGGGCC